MNPVDHPHGGVKENSEEEVQYLGDNQLKV